MKKWQDEKELLLENNKTASKVNKTLYKNIEISLKNCKESVGLMIKNSDFAYSKSKSTIF